MKKIIKYLVAILLIILSISAIVLAYRAGTNSERGTNTKSEKVRGSKDKKVHKSITKNKTKKVNQDEEVNNNTKQNTSNENTVTPTNNNEQKPTSNTDSSTSVNANTNNPSSHIPAGATPINSSDPQKAGAYINKDGQEIDPNQTVINGAGTTGNPYNDFSSAEDD